MPRDRPVPNTGVLVAPEPSVPSNTYTRAFMHLRSPRSLILAAGGVLAMAAPAAAATAPKPLKEKSATLRSASIERQFCAIKVTSGRGVAKMTLKSPVNGTISVRTQGRRGAEWDIAVVDRKRNIVLGGSAQEGAREYASALVRKGQRLAIQGCRQDGASELSVRYQFTKLPEGQGVQVRHEARTGRHHERIQGAPRGARARPHGPPDRDLLGRAAALRRRRGEAQEGRLQLRRPHRRRRGARSRQPPQGAAGGQPAASAWQQGSASPPCPAGARPTARSRTSSRSCGRSRDANPGLVRLVTLPERSWVGREIYGIEIAENVNSNRRRPAVLRAGRHAPRPRVARERGHVGVGHRAHQRLQGRRCPPRGDRQGRPQHHRARAQRRRLRRDDQGRGPDPGRQLRRPEQLDQQRARQRQHRLRRPARTSARTAGPRTG